MFSSISHILVLGIFASVFWFVQMLFAFLNHRKTNKLRSAIPVNVIPKITVIIPVFNELSEAYHNTILSIRAQKNCEVEIIVVDDGSDLPVVINIPDVKLINASHGGKRKAQMAGIAHASHEWIATVDSDTILDESALYNLFCGLYRNKADAGTGTVNLINKHENLLTKMTSAMYWFAFHQERASQSYFNSVVCCSGALSMYRKSIVLDNQEKYLNQVFLGKKCDTGDDRHLTNIFLLSGKKVIWEPSAVAMTFSPPKMAKFLKQQLRWTRSHIISIPFLIENRKNWTKPFTYFTAKLYFQYTYQLNMYLTLIYFMYTHASLWPLAVVILSIFVVATLKTLVASLYIRTTEIAYLIAYNLYGFFVLNPIIIYGLFTPMKDNWLTRVKK